MHPKRALPGVLPPKRAPSRSNLILDRCLSLRAAVISVITNDGRHIVGTLRGYDQATNLILEESHERVYRDDAGVESIVLGLYLIRGDNM